MSISQPHILVVDDQSYFRQIIQAVLRKAGYAVDVVDNGQDAINFCSNEIPDAILLDLNMPGINGLETCEQLKNDQGLYNTPVIILTSSEDADDIHKAFAAGAEDFLFKSMDWELLENRLAQILHSHSLTTVLQSKIRELEQIQRESEIGTIKIDYDHSNIELTKLSSNLLGIEPNSKTITINEMINYVHPDDRKHVEFTFEHAFQKRGWYEVEYRFITPQRDELIINQQGQPLQESENPKKIKIFGVLKNVTELRNAQDALDYQRFNDALTGGYNRKYFELHVKHLLEHPDHESLFAVILIGLDSFSQINDIVGRSGGDFILRTISQRLKTFEEKNFVISVSRFGGDVFSLLTKNLPNIDACNNYAEQILNEIRHPIQYENQQYFLTASIGISIFPIESKKSNQLISNAEAAMITSSEAGGDRYSYRHKHINQTAQHRLQLLKDIRLALCKEQFSVYYQPQIQAQTMQIVGMEALVRWNHPERGLVSPSEFIALAEETDLIIPLGEIVLRKACQDTKIWIDQGYQLKVSVNVSPRQFEEDICELINDILKETQLPAEYLEIEITESMAIRDIEQTIDKLKHLRKLGIKTSMDDFGTGYSSLSQLHLLPLDTLKIDQAFVRRISKFANKKSQMTGYKNSAIPMAIIYMAHALGLEIIAEGVENKEQLTFLIEHQSQVLQGYLFSKPVEAKAFESLLENPEQWQHLHIWR